MSSMLTTRETNQAAPGASDSAFRPYRVTFERYWAMVESGALGNDRVILWDGRLLETMPPGRPHSLSLYLLKAAFDRILPAGYFAEQEQPLALEDDYAPQPDLKVVRGTARDYPTRPPSAADVALVIEVSEWSLPFDRSEMARLYSRGEIPWYWVVNLVERQIEVHADPTSVGGSASYARRLVFGPGASVPVMLDGREMGRVSVDEVLP